MFFYEYYEISKNTYSEKHLQTAAFLVYRTHNRSMHQRCSLRKGILRNFTKFTGNTCARVSFLIKLQAWFLFLGSLILIWYWVLGHHFQVCRFSLSFFKRKLFLIICLFSREHNIHVVRIAAILLLILVTKKSANLRNVHSLSENSSFTLSIKYLWYIHKN